MTTEFGTGWRWRRFVERMQARAAVLSAVPHGGPGTVSPGPLPAPLVERMKARGVGGVEGHALGTVPPNRSGGQSPHSTGAVNPAPPPARCVGTQRAGAGSDPHGGVDENPAGPWCPKDEKPPCQDCPDVGDGCQDCEEVNRGTR